MRLHLGLQVGGSNVAAVLRQRIVGNTLRLPCLAKHARFEALCGWQAEGESLLLRLEEGGGVTHTKSPPTQ